MYELIGKLVALPGKRDKLISVLIARSADMPGCLSYLVAKDVNDPNALWVTEVWDNPASHHASLALPQVQQAMIRGKPLIASVSERFETEPVGGHGLSSPGRNPS